VSALIGFASLLALGGGVFIGAMVAHTVGSLRRPPRRTYAWALSRGVAGDPSELDEPLGFESFVFRGRAHELPAWRVEGLDPRGPCAVLVHGWGSSRVGALARIPAIARWASEILVCDLEGHGESPGLSRMGESEHHDIAALAAHRADERPVLLYGWSMGAGIALRTACDFGEKLGVVGVGAESPYIHAITPARNVIRLRGYPVALNLRPSMALIGWRLGIGPNWSGFARDAIARRVGCRVLVLHGVDDAVCPIRDGRCVARAAPRAEIHEIEHGGHNNLWTDPGLRQEMERALGSFVASLAQADADSTPIA